MILNISGRTDIVAFYTPWLLNRFKAGYFLVRNPFYESQVSRINMDNVDGIIFCTKNPIPIIDHLLDINKPMIFQVTLTPYHKDIEPNVPNKKEIIDAIKQIAEIIGKEKVYIRYDPILLNEKYNLDYHIRAFKKMCTQLKGYTDKIIVSFIDDYKNVRKHHEDLMLIDFTKEDLKSIGIHFAKIASQNNMTVQTCHEQQNLIEYGFTNDVCVSRKLAFELTGKTNFKLWTARNCGCVEMVDIGAYNSCHHYCKYCYANYDEKQIQKNCELHDPNSPLLIGKINPNDNIKTRFK